MAKDDRTFIFVHDGMPEHWKVEDLSDSAFRLMITLWCWCSRQRTDGRVPERKWLRSGSGSDRAELIDAGLFDPSPVDNGVVVHDYLEHQRSRDDIRKRQQASRKANHVRHHVKAGRFDPACDLCVLGDRPPTPPPRSDSDSDSDSPSDPTLTPADSQSRSEERREEERRISQSARAREAGRWLQDRYGRLTDQETAAVIEEVHRRAPRPIHNLIPYLQAMKEGDLADIVGAAMDTAEKADRPQLSAVPDLPAEPADAQVWPPAAETRPAGAPPPRDVLDELRDRHGWRRTAT